MKRLDQIIKEHVDRAILEQRAELIQLNATDKYDKTNKHILSKSNVHAKPSNAEDFGFKKWSGGVGLWKNSAAQQFLKSFSPATKCAEIEPLAVTFSLSKITATKPEYVWTFGSNSYIIRDNNTIEMFDDHHTLYWKWLPNGAYQINTTTAMVTTKTPLGIPSRGAMELRTKYATGDSPILGWIYIEKNGDSNFEYFTSGIEQDAKLAARNKEERMLDVMQWAGAFPVIGEAFDFVSAAIHFQRATQPDGTIWDAFEGILSLVACFPVYGSVVRGVVKKIANKYKKKRIKDLKTLLEAMAKDETSILSDTEKQAFKELLEAAIDKVTWLRRKVGTNLSEVGFKEVDQALERLQKFLQDNSYYYNQFLEKIGGRLAKEIGKKKLLGFDRMYKVLYNYNPKPDEQSMKGAGTAIGQALLASGIHVPGWVEVIKNVLTRLVSVGNWFKIMQANQKVIVENIQNAFTKSLQQDEDKLITFLLFAQKNPGSEFVAMFSKLKIIPNNLKSIDNALLDQFKNKVKIIQVPELVTKTGMTVDPITKALIPGTKELKLVEKSTADASLEQINEWLSATLDHENKKYVSKYTADVTTSVQDFRRWIKKSKANEYGDFNGKVKALVKSEAEYGNPLWNYILIDPLNHVQGVFPTSLSTFAKALAANFLNYRKYLDAFYEGVHEFLQDVGVAEDDKVKTSITYEWIKQTINLGSKSKDNLTWVAQSAASKLNIIKKGVGVKTNAAADYELRGVDRDSTWRPLEVPRTPSAIAASTNAVKIPKQVGTSNSGGTRRPVMTAKRN